MKYGLLGEKLKHSFSPQIHNAFGIEDYILKEAEMLVTDYINKIENKKKSEKNRKDITANYKMLKYYSIISTVLLIISLTINFI